MENVYELYIKQRDEKTEMEIKHKAEIEQFMKDVRLANRYVNFVGSRLHSDNIPQTFIDIDPYFKEFDIEDNSEELLSYGFGEAYAVKMIHREQKKLIQIRIPMATMSHTGMLSYGDQFLVTRIDGKNEITEMAGRCRTSLITSIKEIIDRDMETK